MAISSRGIRTSTLALMALGAVGAAAPSALAILGSFGPSDGYSLSVYSGSVNWCDVSYYNAGGYGINAGNGPGPTFINPDSGKWRVVGPVGGFFTSAANRAAGTAGAPAYSPTMPANTAPAYMVGGHFPGRNGDGYNLAFRNDTPAGTGPCKYEYDLDVYDTGGPIPTSVTSGIVTTQFYFMADPDMPQQPGSPPRDKFTLSWKDSSGNIGLEFGYTRANEITWRSVAGGSWNYTGVFSNPGSWDGVKMSLDLTNDTFQFDYYDVINNTWTTFAPAGTPMGASMNNFSTLRWQLEDATSLGLGGKNMFDDFSFSVPAASAATLMALGLGAFARRRR